MALNFTNATDVVQLPVPAFSGTTQSFVIWTKLHGLGPSNAGRAISFLNGGATVITLDVNSAVTTQFEYIRGFSTTNGRWTFTRPSADVWHHILISHNAGATVNNPFIWVDGAAVIVTRATAPVGTAISSVDEGYLGNNSTGIRNWDGDLAEFALWNRAFQTVGADTLGSGNYSPITAPGSRVAYVPLIREAFDFHNGVCTLTGTTASDHPRVVWGRAVGRQVTAAVTSTAFTQAVAGTLTSAGTLVRANAKLVAGTLTTAGALVRKTTKPGFAGTLTSSGALTRQAGKKFAGTLTSSGTVSAVRAALVALAGTLTSAGTLRRSVAKPLSGTLTSSGALVRSVARLLAGTLTSAGAVTRLISKSLVGTLGLAGSLAKRIATAFTGTLTSAGAVVVEAVVRGSRLDAAVPTIRSMTVAHLARAVLALPVIRNAVPTPTTRDTEPDPTVRNTTVDWS